MWQKDKDGFVITTEDNNFCVWLCVNPQNYSLSLAFGKHFRFIFTFFRIWKNNTLGIITHLLNPYLIDFGTVHHRVVKNG